MTDQEKEDLAAEYTRLRARQEEMREELVGCDWCCGGGDQEWDEIDARCDEIQALLQKES